MIIQAGTGVDPAGRWCLASSSKSRKGEELAVSTAAALAFYWPEQGRQIRVRVLYALTASEVEFWQADRARRRVRLRYDRQGEGWRRQRLWP